MEGYDVVTVDEHKIGTVVGESGDFLIVEQGTLRKSKHPLPREFAHVDDGEQQVRVTVPKEIVSDSPTADDGIDERAVKAYYGLTNEPGPGDDGLGGESMEEQAAHMRDGEASGLPPPSPALLGDRVADIDDRDQEER